ncbi:hypothetical protein SAMN05660479_01414 [Microbulbifer thermotolerans]|nr:hypothetical protein SAMN05660479_01414 [Microbulbifer thermotolerans]
MGILCENWLTIRFMGDKFSTQGHLTNIWIGDSGQQTGMKGVLSCEDGRQIRRLIL